MKRLLQRSTKHAFVVYSLAFALMVLPPIGMYFAAQAEGLTLGLLALVVIGNILVLFPG